LQQAGEAIKIEAIWRDPMLANILIALVALLHFGFLYLEMIAWDQPLGRKVFRTTPEFSAASKALAANQGLYNGFLAAGLIWGLWLGDAGFAVKAFFLVCVMVAGLFGAATVNPRIAYVQAMPAALALIALRAGI
jgi:putative membrane protein